jgi:FtsH-binding integral membrane protein
MFGIVVWLMQTFVGEVEFLQNVYALCGCLLFSIFIVYDTQLIVGGKHKKHQFGVDDYVFAALSLYMDIINLFLFILSASGGRD